MSGSEGLGALYDEMILEHGRKPRNRRAQAVPPALETEGYNPLCGDRVRVYVTLDGDRIADVSFEGEGCAISTASASMMTEALRGRSRAEADELFDRFHALLTESGAEADESALGALAALGGVRAYPMRVKCATLAWHTLRSALAGEGGATSTE